MAAKISYIELMDYNVLLSLLDYFNSNIKDYSVSGKTIEMVPSYMDIKIPYKVPAISMEILYRRNRSVGFGSYYGDEEIIVDNVAKIAEIEGTIMEYRIQFNVYSNTRGENHKWSSILDEVLKNGELGIDLNTYLDNGNIKQAAIGDITYDFSTDARSNMMNPNIKTYDIHNIYELKCSALQKYNMIYDYMELGDIIGKLK
jgi:hypothetical protein